jgi:hypothetical protein
MEQKFNGLFRFARELETIYKQKPKIKRVSHCHDENSVVCFSAFCSELNNQKLEEVQSKISLFVLVH